MVLEVNQQRVVIAQKEDPLNFKMGATVSDSQKALALRVTAYFDQVSAPRSKLTVGMAVRFSTFSRAESSVVTRPVVALVLRWTGRKPLRRLNPRWTPTSSPHWKSYNPTSKLVERRRSPISPILTRLILQA